jgi:hypothetical protein
MRAFLTVSITLLAAGPAFAEDPVVVMAAARSGRIEFYSETLGKLGAISGIGQLESVTASPDGRMLYVARSDLSQTKSCGLYSLDIASRNMCLLTEPALFGLPSPDGNYLFTQGVNGVDVFDRSLFRLTTMKALGAYNLQASPDGQWLLGIANSPKPSLDIFDLRSLALARRLPIPAGPVTGAWAGGRFYIFNYGGAGIGRLWSANPANNLLEEAPPIQLPDLYGGCRQPMLLMLAGAPDKLFLAEGFGFKVDRRDACSHTTAGGVPGGIYVMQLSTGRVNILARAVHVNRMAVTPDGRDLYAIQAGEDEKHDVNLIHIDVGSGKLSQIDLQPGEWSLALAHIPADLMPRGSRHDRVAQTLTYCRR